MSVMTWAQTEAETWEALANAIDRGGVIDPFDICLSKRALAVKAGAIEVTARELCSRKWSQSAPGGAA